MMFKWKLRGRLTALTLCSGLLPLLITIIYVGHSSSIMLEDQALNYMKVKVDAFSRMADMRYTSIEGNLDIIKEQLVKSLKADLIKEASKETYFRTGYLSIFGPDGTCFYHP
ncbi:MAG: hypothetical protein LLG43_07625, partial [Deltaproteobacteria bacterium]|nr:hypothetical protein [Deltaproteobacteria bacterium]